jgi:hypothetical protein
MYEKYVQVNIVENHNTRSLMCIGYDHIRERP